MPQLFFTPGEDISQRPSQDLSETYPVQPHAGIKEIQWHYQLGDSHSTNFTGTKCLNKSMEKIFPTTMCSACPIDLSLAELRTIYKENDLLTALVFPFKDDILRIVRDRKKAPDFSDV